ncbi:FAD-dependent oxidoreductase [Lactobacillus porci]|uniref:FAD-dependent oxidoreductase n=1 Tax=Lactobacillus porci TaxID=2012477 RepID=UPI003993D57E
MSYQDGKYQTEAEGLHGPVKVATTISGGKISAVEVLAGPGEYQSKANEVVTKEIIAAQSPEVDAVSGATVSSNAIMTAVKKALQEAGGKVASKTSEELTTDLAVVAAGPAGLAAAVAAAEQGLKVLVFEKEQITGGTANMGMGPLGINTRIQKSNFNDISVAEALKNQLEYTHYRVNGRLVARYFKQSASTIEWLEKMGVKFSGAYRYFKESNATWHIVDPGDGKIGPGCAAAMNKAMTKRAEELGVKFYLETPVKQLLTKGKQVTGLVAQSAESEYVVHAKAVVVATGGYGSNAEMLKERQKFELNQNFFTFNVPGIMGDGLKMMWEAGAQKYGDTVEMIYILPHNLEYMVADGVLRQPNLMLNQKGERFMDEGMLGNTTFSGNAIFQQPGHYAYVIMDRAILKRYQEEGPDIMDLVHPAAGFKMLDPVIKKAEENGYEAIITADTVAELAEKLAIPADKLQKQIDDYNSYCEHGQDTEFFKNPAYLHKLTGEGGYLVGKFYSGAYGTVGGVKIDENCQVLDDEDRAIPGLYSAGSDANTIYADSYNFTLPGNTMGFAVNSGRIAGLEAAKQILR